MKAAVWTGLSVLGLFALLCILNAHRSFVNSPDGTKTITVYRPVSWFWRSDYYLIPERYTAFFPPDNNYALIEPAGMCFLEVNWAPMDAYLLKMAFSSGCTRNCLTSRVYMSPTGFFENYRDGKEAYQWPKYGSYPLNEILHPQ